MARRFYALGGVYILVFASKTARDEHCRRTIDQPCTAVEARRAFRDGAYYKGV